MELDSFVERTLTELDHARLTRLTRGAASSRRRGEDSPLDHALDSAALVPSPTIPPDVVTMHSSVVLRDRETSRRDVVTLSYPADADPAAGRVSVLAPLGASLLGLRVGDEARWALPNGREGVAQLEAIVFQPESNGDFTR